VVSQRRFAGLRQVCSVRARVVGLRCFDFAVCCFALALTALANEEFVTGLSPRSSLNLLQASRAWAFLEGRGYVLPEDVQAVLPSVVGHRLQSAAGLRNQDSEEIARRLITEVAVP
jgi:MoxR-like ATPase